MNNLTRSIALSLCLIAGAFAQNSLDVPKTSVLTATITAATLAANSISTPLSVSPTVSGAYKPLAVSQFTYDVDVNGNLNVGFSASFTGTINIQGAWPQYTTGSNDFAVSVGGYTSSFYTCLACASGAVVRYLPANGVTYVSNQGAMLQWTGSGASTYSVFSYIKGNRVTYGISAASGSASATNADIEWSVSSMPGSVVPLGETTITSGVFSTANVVDDRPANFKSGSPSFDVRQEPVIIIVK